MRVSCPWPEGRRTTSPASRSARRPPWAVAIRPLGDCRRVQGAPADDRARRGTLRQASAGRRAARAGLHRCLRVPRELPVSDARREDVARDGSPRDGRGPSRCAFSESTSAEPSRRRAARRRPCRHRQGADRGAQEESVVGGRAGGRRPERSTDSRTARRWPRTRCSSARAPGPRSSAPPASSTSCTSAARRGRTSTGCADHNPEPLVAARALLRRRASGSGPDGVLEPLDLGSLPAFEADAVAVCLLFAFRDPTHEQAVAEELRRRLPHAHVVASHEVSPEFREYERASTTAVDAYLGPRGGPLPGGARRRPAARAGLPEPLVMRSSGGVATVAEAAAHPSWILVSGPAGGVVGASLVARRAGFENAVSFDMGGTSTDVCLIAGGRAERSAERRVGGLPVRLPSVDIHTVGAGGGSIVWIDPGGAIRVGPRERRRDPGPGLLRARRRPADGDRRQSPARPAAGSARRAASSSTATRRSGRSATSTPRAVVEIVNAEMLRALRVVSVERGHDPRDFALVAFGGAGPLHACALAEELGIADGARPGGGRRALRARPGGERRAAGPRALVRPRRSPTWATCRTRARPTFATRGSRSSSPSRSARSLAERFHRAHEERYGYADRGRRDRARRRQDRRRRARARRSSSARGEPLEVRGPGGRRAPRRDVLGPPRVGGGRDGRHATLILSAT